MIYSERVITRLDDFDCSARLKPSSVLKLFENCADHHTDTVRDSELKTLMHSAEWILTEWSLNISRLPKRGEKLFAETYIRGKGPCVRCEREFRLKCGDELLVTGQTMLSLLDVDRGRVVRISEELMNKYGPEQDGIFDMRRSKLRLPESFELSVPFALRRSDLDYNRHVHNTAYLDFATELIPDEALRCDPLSVRIMYKRALKAGDSPVACAHNDAGLWTLAVMCDGELCTVCEVDCRRK
mgnify:FL=1